jgi:spore coat assembly protein SafA
VKYTVQSGDTLWLIAKKFGVSLNDLIQANPQITNPDRININDVIIIPGTGMGPGHDYEVKKGDTLWLIAKKFGVSLDALIKANPQIADPNRINIGDIIHIPGTDMENDTGDNDNDYVPPKTKAVEPVKTKIKYKEQMKPAQVQQEHQENDGPNTLYYVIKTGDTLLKIAKMFGISLPKLLEANKHIEDPDKVYPGNKIKVLVEKEYVEKKYAPQQKPEMAEMPETTSAMPEKMAPTIGTTPAKPVMPETAVMPGTTPAKPAAMPGTTPAMPAMQHNCPMMMHHCPCMFMMHPMHMMNMMHSMHMMPMMDVMPEMEQMPMAQTMDQTNPTDQFPCFGESMNKKKGHCKQHHSSDKDCKHRN